MLLKSTALSAVLKPNNKQILPPLEIKHSSSKQIKESSNKKEGGELMESLGSPILLSKQTNNIKNKKTFSLNKKPFPSDNNSRSTTSDDLARSTISPLKKPPPVIK